MSGEAGRCRLILDLDTGIDDALALAYALGSPEVELVGEILGSRPILLLDDVMSELDAHRRAAMVRFVDDGIQTLITTTNLGYFSPELLDGAKVVSFGE